MSTSGYVDNVRTADGEAAARGEVSGEEGHRTGERTLTLLSTSLNLAVLRTLSERPMRLAELRQATGLPAQTTLRGHLGALGAIGAVSKRPTTRMPYAVESELTPMGRDLLDVAAKLEAWLGRAPERSISLESGAAKGVVKAFVDGWGSTVTRNLAAGPMSLTELDRAIVELSYPSLERRLSSMRMAKLVEARPGNGAGTPYAVTEWARRGVVPLAVASRCERVHMGGDAASVAPLDVEAAFMLSTPLVRLPEGESGSCRFEVEPEAGGLPEPTRVQVTVENGGVVSCQAQAAADAGSDAVGSAQSWIAAVTEGRSELLRFSGSCPLAERLVSALHSALMRR